MAFLVVAQLLLPLALIAWLALSPPASRLGLLLDAAALLVLAAALLLAGLWTVLPWWLAWLLAALAAAAIVRAAAAWPGRWLPRTAGWLRAVVAAAVIAVAAPIATEAVAGRRPPAEPPLALASSLPPGRYIVANGGLRLAVNAHVETLDQALPRRRLWRGQSYGLDIVGLGPLGSAARGLPSSDPAGYAIFGRPVLAPCDGQVVAAADGAPDNRVPFVPRDADPGNFALLRCGGAEVLLAHFRERSLRVAAGQPVRRGQVLGEVGNSGASSEPHLHLHAQAPGSPAAPFAGRPIPVTLDGRWLVRNARF